MSVRQQRVGLMQIHQVLIWSFPVVMMSKMHVYHLKPPRALTYANCVSSHSVQPGLCGRPPLLQPINTLTLLEVITLYTGFFLTDHTRANNSWPPTSTMWWAASLWQQCLTHLGDQTAQKNRGLRFWHVLPSSAKPDLTWCKVMAKKPRTHQLNVPSQSRGDSERQVGTSDSTWHSSRHAGLWLLMHRTG